MSKIKGLRRSLAAVLMGIMLLMNCTNVYADETGAEIDVETNVDENIEVNVETDAEIGTETDTTTDTATAGELFRLEAYSVAITDRFELNYYLKVADAVKNDATSYVQFTVDGKTQKSYASTNASGLRLYTCALDAKQLNENIKAELFYNGSFYSISNFSVRKYMDTLLGNSKYAYAAEVARAALNYGGYAQQYFNYKTSSLANQGLYAAGQNPVELMSDSMITGSIRQSVVNRVDNEDLSYIGASLICNSEMSLRLYFQKKSSLTLDEIKNKYNYYVVGKRFPLEIGVDGNILYMELKNVTAVDWDRTFKFTFDKKNSNNSMYVQYNHIIYVKEAMATQNTKLKNLCKAIYLYNVAAKEYTGLKETKEYTRFDVPYVSTYYFNPKPTVNDNVTIPLYLSDYEQTDYFMNDTSVKFDLIYEIDGNEKTLRDVPIGDYNLELGKLPEGMHSFSIQILDKRTGLKSARLFNELWVVDTYEIPESLIYHMTATDLATYHINNNDSTDATDLINTRDGLTALFADIQNKGYRKIVLYKNENDKNIYRINGENARYNCILIPSNFTVDMNGCTFKLDTFTADTAGCIVCMDNVFDAHIENGVLEGNRYERKELGLEVNGMGEGINTILIRSGKFCSIKNMTIRNTTGHTFYTEQAMAPYYILRGYTHTAIVDGVEIADESCSTSAMMDLTDIINWDPDEDYIFIGYKGGYRGIRTDSRTVYVSFYDQNQNFLETITGCQYRKIAIPKNSKYARVTVLSSDIQETGSNVLNIYTTRLGDYYEVSNISFENTRTCAIAPTTCNNLLLEYITYTNCADSITPVPVDFEDGWEECQDVYYRNNTVISNAAHTTGTIVDNAGYNHVYENCTNHRIGINGRLIGGVVRGMNDERDTVRWDLGTKKSNEFGRIYNNEKTGAIFFICQGGAADAIDFKVKNSTIYYEERVIPELLVPADKIVYENCTFPKFQDTNGTFVNCTIQPTGYIKDYVYFYGCTFKALDDSESILLNFRSPYLAERVFDDCTFVGKTTLGSIHSGTFKNCKFDDVNIIAFVDSSAGEIVFENCTIKSSAENFIYTGEQAYDVKYINIRFTDCEITHTGENLIGLNAMPADNSQMIFDNCTITKSEGALVKWLLNYSRAANLSKISVDITFTTKNDISKLEIDGSVDEVYARITVNGEKYVKK